MRFTRIPVPTETNRHVNSIRSPKRKTDTKAIALSLVAAMLLTACGLSAQAQEDKVYPTSRVPKFTFATTTHGPNPVAQSILASILDDLAACDATGTLFD